MRLFPGLKGDAGLSRYTRWPKRLIKGWACSSVVECLLSIHKVLGSMPNTHKYGNREGVMVSSHLCWKDSGKCSNAWILSRSPVFV